MDKFKNWSVILVGILTISCQKYPEDIGKGYKVDFNSRGSADKAILDSRNTILIHGPILTYKYDSQFIVTAERPRDSIPECSKFSKGRIKDCDTAFENSTFLKYWIIDKNQKLVFDERSVKYSNVYGPYKFDEYKTKLDELKISEELELNVE